MLRASRDPPLQTGSSEAGESGAGVHSTFPLVRDGTLPPARAPSSTWGSMFSTKTRDLAHRGDLLPPPQEPHVPDHPSGHLSVPRLSICASPQFQLVPHPPAFLSPSVTSSKFSSARGGFWGRLSPSPGLASVLCPQVCGQGQPCVEGVGPSSYCK